MPKCHKIKKESQFIPVVN